MILKQTPNTTSLCIGREILTALIQSSYLKTDMCGVMMFHDVGEIAQWLRALAALPQDWFIFQHSHDGLQSSVTPILGNMTPSFTFEGITHGYTAMHSGKTHIQILKTAFCEHNSLCLSYFHVL